MKGIVLAGGTGTRLYPVTIAVNKHLLPIYNKPMIYYPLSLMMLIEIREIAIVVNPEDIRHYEKLFGDGSKLGIRIELITQDKPRGVADALLQARSFADGDDVCLMLGDNIFFGNGLPDFLMGVRRSVEMEGGAHIFAYYVHDPSRYGIVELDENERILSIEEKPRNPKSNLAVVGLYFYDRDVFDVAASVEVVPGNEHGITQVNRAYLGRGKCRASLLGRGVAWFDAGTYNSFLEASEFVSAIERRTGLMIGCIEEIAHNKGWIDDVQLQALIKTLRKTEYGDYLVKVMRDCGKPTIG